MRLKFLKFFGKCPTHTRNNYKNFKTWKVYLNDEKHPIIYFRCAICRYAYTQEMAAEIFVYNSKRKSRDKLSSRIAEMVSLVPKSFRS